MQEAREGPDEISADASASTANSCGIAVMAKASAPGRTKTRLVPPLTGGEAAAFNTAFLQDISTNILEAARDLPIQPYMAYGPPGPELSVAFFRDVLPPDVRLLEAWWPDFGSCLYGAIDQLLELGHTSAVVLNSDSPTLPTSLLVATAEMLAQPGDRAVLGPSTDGGYYLLGLKSRHRRLFQDIAWSTDQVAGQTLARAAEIGLAVHLLPAWYDVDDAQSLSVLYGELFEDRPFARGLGSASRSVLRPADAHAAGAQRPRRPSRYYFPSIARGRHRLTRWPKSDAHVAAQKETVHGRTLAGRTRRRPAPLLRKRGRHAARPSRRKPVCLYLETTNRCNLLCTTCPRTYADLEPQADMSWELFTRIVDQVPNIARVVLHGVGEPMLVKDLPRMIRYLKDRGAYVLFNTNGTRAHRQEGPRARRHRARRAARLARCGRCPHLPAGARQGLFQPHRAQRACFHRDAGARRSQPPARLALADGAEGNHRPAARLRAHRPRDRRQGGLPAAAGVLRGGAHRHGTARPGPVRAPERRRRRTTCGRPKRWPPTLGISFNASGATEPGESLERKADRTLVAVPAAVER